MSKKKREPVDPEHLKPEDRMKFEIAKELGLADKVIAGGWRCLYRLFVLRETDLRR